MKRKPLPDIEQVRTDASWFGDDLDDDWLSFYSEAARLFEASSQLMSACSIAGKHLREDVLSALLESIVNECILLESAIMSKRSIAELDVPGINSPGDGMLN